MVGKEIIHLKETIKKGETVYIMEVKGWEVSKSKAFPEGLKYSFVLVKNGERILGYDNERSKGPHKHFQNKEVKVKFEGFENLLLKFWKEVKDLIKNKGGKNEQN